MSLEVTAARPSTGPRDPMATTPPRPPGSVRRTTNVDQRRSELGQPQSIRAAGRDLRTLADGTGEVVDEVRLSVEVDGAGVVTGLAAEPPVPALAELVGGHVSKGLRARVAALVPEHVEGATVLHQLLDDLPMANLISMYGSSRERSDFTLEPDRAAAMTDLCSGWRAGGTMLDVLERTGIFPIPVGPTAPDLRCPDDELAWHDLPAMARRSIRRRRRIDVQPGDVLQVDAHFRDSHCDEQDLEDVLHEYEVTATVDPVSLVVRSSAATVHVLPWPECPGAVASAARIEGRPVAGLREQVAAELTGISTCTHLNDVLRSVAGVSALARALP